MTLNRTQAPTCYDPVDFEFVLPNCQQLNLDNGIPLYAVSDCPEPVVQIELVFPAGMWYESKTAVSQATAALLKSGTPSRTSKAIHEDFEQYGASLKAGSGSDWASVSLSCLTRHLPRVLPLLGEILQEANFPEDELAIYKQNSKQRLSVQLRKGDFIANRHIDALLFGASHPYGRVTQMQDYDLLQQNDLQQHLQLRYNSRQSKIFMAGQFDESAVKLINQILGQHAWNQQGTEPEIPKTQMHEQKKHRIEHDPHSVQGSVRLIRTFPDRSHPDFPGMQILNTVFGGYFGSRLMTNIREDKGYTYGIHSYLYNNRFDGAYLITTEAGKDVCEATLTEIYTEMKRLREEMIPEDELNLVRNYLLGNILGDLDGAFQIIQRWKNLILHGFNADRFYHNIQVYKTIDAHALQQLANAYLKADDFYELLVM